MSDIVVNADKTVSGWFDNQYFTAVLALLLIFYSAYGASRLSPYVLRLFDMPLFRVLVFLLIVYIARKTPTIAIIAAIAFMVTLHNLTKMKLDDVVMDSARKESMENIQNVQDLEAHFQQRPKVTVQELTQQEMTLPETAASEIAQESRLETESQSGECVVPLQYRNSFYPQYNNQDQVGRNVRFAEGEGVVGRDVTLGNPEINGYDPNSNYAAL